MNKKIVPREIRAVVADVCGDNGNRYAIAYPNPEQSFLYKEENITFSLSDWLGSQEPRKAQIVILSELHQFVRGWRALRASPAEEVL